ncbi:hypothetical protein TNCT_543031 [Trichonephila clavata]|uniref:Uncharacterized protein n=1 Tax=Trichonephila clavata TaxID=2740835 RepID=A0A8X6JCY7_TRICU|nr:hypothetical protein TNCT_543031 [Trichonephila clavata]
MLLLGQELDVVSQTNGWDNRTRVTQLVTALRGQAFEVVKIVTGKQINDSDFIENAHEYFFVTKKIWTVNDPDTPAFSKSALVTPVIPHP